jgi:hypothetical protein
MPIAFLDAADELIPLAIDLGEVIVSQLADKSGPFWVYFPQPGTVWGQSSSGDVDIHHWWTDGGRYCRSWRVWYARIALGELERGPVL